MQKLSVACFLVLGLLAIGRIVFGPSADVAGTALAQEPSSDEKAVEPSMHEFMEYVFQPTYPRLKHSMMAVPADNKGWKAIKSDRRGVHQCSTFAG